MLTRNLEERNRYRLRRLLTATSARLPHGGRPVGKWTHCYAIKQGSFEAALDPPGYLAADIRQVPPQRLRAGHDSSLPGRAMRLISRAERHQRMGGSLSSSGPRSPLTFPVSAPPSSSSSSLSPELDSVGFEIVAKLSTPVAREGERAMEVFRVSRRLI